MLLTKLKKIVAKSLTYFLVGSITMSSGMGLVFFDGHDYLGLDSEQKTAMEKTKIKQNIALTRQSPKREVEPTIDVEPKQNMNNNTTKSINTINNTTQTINTITNNTNNQNQVSNNKSRTNNSAPIPESQLPLLARIIQAEAGGESIRGQVAVGAVLLNRIRSGRFPRTLSANIFRPGEFESVSNGYIWAKEPSSASYNAARLALKGWDPTYGALYFYNPAKSSSRWIWTRPIIVIIGQHTFAG